MVRCAALVEEGTANALVVTQGDPHGVGPELILHAAAAGKLRVEDTIVADRGWLAEVAAEVAARAGEPAGWAQIGLASLSDGAARIVDPAAERPRGPEAPPEAPLDAFAALVAGTAIVSARRGHALVTAPLDKAVAQGHGLAFPGHTEFLAAHAGVPSAIMALIGPELRVALVTVHVPLAEVATAITVRRIARAGVALGLALQRMQGIARPVIGVLGLNPHAGERGLLGVEDQAIVTPAVAWLRAWGADRGIAFDGPLPADTAFHAHAGGRFHGLVAQYHDQGLAPFKLAHFHDGVNVTLGLPFVRTSPDHGTAKDIARTGSVDPRSFFAAIELARGAAPVTWREGELPA
jgi:4-hydroxythreonine-4-phosphate dehydrogenase